MSPKISVIGAGAWGSALSTQLARLGLEPTLFDRDEAIVSEINNKHTNRKYFGDSKFLKEIKAELISPESCKDAELVVLAVPSVAFYQVIKFIKPSICSDTKIVIATKGIEGTNLKLFSDIVADEIGNIGRVFVLSGPSFSKEVFCNLPTAVVIAGKFLDKAKEVSRFFHGDNFRVYTSSDLIGVQVGGVVKNVIALACGVSDGLSLGLNARSALITRGLSELKRLVVAMNGDIETASGLSGLGDLVLTSTGDLSRNRRFGKLLANSFDIESALKEIGSTVEAVDNVKQVVELATKFSISMPISTQVCRLIFDRVEPRDILKELLSREQKNE